MILNPDKIPKRFKPQVIEDFVGPARRAATIVKNSADSYTPIGEPGLFLFYGPPGAGKTELAKLCLRLFDVKDFHRTSESGTDMDVEKVRCLAEQLRQRSMFPGYRGVLVDEIDKMPKVAQVRFLKLADDLANHVMVVATCNSGVDDLELRFHSRWQTFPVTGPTGEECRSLLERWLTPDEAARLINGATNDDPEKEVDLRALLNDATTLLLAKRTQ